MKKPTDTGTTGKTCKDRRRFPALKSGPNQFSPLREGSLFENGSLYVCTRCAYPLLIPGSVAIDIHKSLMWENRFIILNPSLERTYQFQCPRCACPEFFKGPK